MFPVRDNLTSKEIPYVTYTLVALNVAIYFWDRNGYPFGPGVVFSDLAMRPNDVVQAIKGGAAAAQNHFDFGLNVDGVPLAATSSTRWGGNIGAGLEYGFAPQWSVAVEYNHLFLGRRNESFGPNLLSNTGVVESIRQDADMVTARLNYRFGGSRY